MPQSWPTRTLPGPGNLPRPVSWERCSRDRYPTAGQRDTRIRTLVIMVAMGIPKGSDGGERAVLALVAHDEKKDDLLRLVTRYRATLENLRLVATGHTGAQLADALDLEIEQVHSGPEGGDLEIGAMIVGGHVDAVVFLRDPLSAHPHEPDIQALLKVCDVHGVPLATNLASAEILLRSLSHAMWWGRSAATAQQLDR